MLVIGLTGSIGMGKSTVAGFFQGCGVPVFDADAAVHALYAPGGAAVAPIAKRFPGAVADGAVNRAALAGLVLGDAEALQELEAIVHPLVQAARARFLEAARTRGEPLAVVEVPLLLETGGERDVDLVVVVSAGEDIQRARVLARPGMTEAKFAAILARQMPESEKRRRADHVIDSSAALAATKAEVRALVERLRSKAERHGR